jgi:UDP-3-O-[3-hydroxymyristoyl] glucosamine N-acyltransferase
MADPRFFRNCGPLPLGQVAALAGAELIGGSADQLVRDVASLEEATEHDVTFLDNRKYAPQAGQTRAAACLIHPDAAAALPAGVASLVSTEPYRAYARVAAAFYPDAGDPAERTAPPASSAGAWVHPEARVDPSCLIAPGAVIEAAAELGARCRIGANAVIGGGVVLGENCVIGSGATLSHAIVGNHVIVHAGVRIGQDGFGFAMGEGGHLKVPQLGRVLIEDEVEIGANTTIDRGSGPDTVIGRGCKIDNLVMIAHNVRLGPGCVVVAQTGIAGSTRIGAGSVLAAQVGVAGHLTIGPGVQLAGRSAVIRDLPGHQVYGGAPAIPVKEWRRQMAAISRLGKGKGSAR